MTDHLGWRCQKRHIWLIRDEINNIDCRCRFQCKFKRPEKWTWSKCYILCKLTFFLHHSVAIIFINILEKGGTSPWPRFRLSRLCTFFGKKLVKRLWHDWEELSGINGHLMKCFDFKVSYIYTVKSQIIAALK